MNPSQLLKLLLGLAVLAPASVATSAAENPKVISLAGKWQFKMDRQDAGATEAWYNHNLTDRINLPGTMTQNGFGDEITVATKWTGQIVDKSYFVAPEYEKYRQPGNIKVPFWLQPEKYYVGAAWYQRDFNIPVEWKGKRVILTLERPHWETRVWVDGRLAGTNNSLSTPHEYDLGTALAPGKHRLAIRVDNRLVVDVGVNSHSVTDHTQGNWNGIAGRIELSATSPVWIDDLQVYPHLATKSATVKGKLGNATSQAGQGKLTLSVGMMSEGSRTLKESRLRTEIPISWNAQGGSFQTEISLGNMAQPWDEFSPVVYRLAAQLDSQPTAKTITFGLREITTQGTQFMLNGGKIFIRGTLECAIFPLTGHPPTDVDSWKRIVRTAKAHGLNNIRFHSWCPPEAAFIAADELGFYYQVECASWANTSTTLGDGKPIDQWLYDEADRILKAYGNHPSFLLMPYGNEPGGPRHVAYLAKWVTHYKQTDARRLYTSGSGWPQIPENQFHVSPDPRVQAWGGGLKSRINARPPETVTDYRDYVQKRAVPVISHEIGQWCVYPNFDEISKYKGYLKPKNFEIFRESLEAHHLSNLAHDFLLASGKLQTLCYKEDIESALRTPGMGGFQLLDLHDFPGQGTALVGVLDPFWDSKGYVTSKEFSRFCNSTVPLARLQKRIWTTDETLTADLEVAHFGPVPLENTAAIWKLVTETGKTVSQGRLPSQTIPVGNGVSLGKMSVALKTVSAPARYKLVIGLEGTRFENDWDIWIYPTTVDTQLPSEVTMVEALNDQALTALDKGGKVLLLIPPSQVKGDKLGKIAFGFSSIFWNTAWTGRQPPHTLGILCNPKNAALASFPTEFHSNWQWWYLITRSQPMILDGLPTGLRPIVQVVDDWFTNRRLGLVFEGKVRNGKLLVCSIDLRKDLDANPVARQMLNSLLSYMKSSRFKPGLSLTVEQINGLITAPSAK